MRGCSDLSSELKAMRALATRAALAALYTARTNFITGRSIAAQTSHSGMALATAGAWASLTFNYRTVQISPNEIIVPDLWCLCLLICVFLSSRGGCHSCYMCAHTDVHAVAPF